MAGTIEHNISVAKNIRCIIAFRLYFVFVIIMDLFLVSDSYERIIYTIVMYIQVLPVTLSRGTNNCSCLLLKIVEL